MTRSAEVGAIVIVNHNRSHLGYCLLQISSDMEWKDVDNLVAEFDILAPVASFEGNDMRKITPENLIWHGLNFDKDRYKV